MAKTEQIARSPERIGPIKAGHVRVLEHMLNHRIGRAAMMKPQPNNHIMAEIAALSAAVAALNEMLAQREKET